MSWRTKIALALVAVAVTGCGAFGEDDGVTERVEQPLVLTKAQVQRHPDGSPERTLFEWWRALQFDNAVIASEYYTRELGMTPARMDRMLKLGPQQLGTTRRPLLVEVDENGEHATVLVKFEGRTKNPNGRIDKVLVPRGFNLIREQGTWRLAENMYLERIKRQYDAFSAPLREKQREG